MAESWRKNVTAVTSDFYVDEETGMPKVVDQSVVVVGGMVTSKTVKSTKNNKMMAFLQLEDLMGTVEVIVFPIMNGTNQNWRRRQSSISGVVCPHQKISRQS